jgi:flagellar biosynthesis protein FlhF
VAQDVEQLAMSTLSFQDYVRERMLKRRRCRPQRDAELPPRRAPSRRGSRARGADGGAAAARPPPRAPPTVPRPSPRPCQRDRPAPWPNRRAAPEPARCRRLPLLVPRRSDHRAAQRLPGGIQRRSRRRPRDQTKMMRELRSMRA